MSRTHARFRHPSLTAVRAFEAAARLGSFTRAAEELHLTQSAISRHVRALEAWFALPLFARAGRAVQLTEAGREYYRAVGEGLARIGFANDALLMQGAPGPVVTVSLSPSLATHWLAPRLGRFLARHPDIEVRLRASNALLDARWEGVDLALRYGSAGWPGVQAEPLGGETLTPVVAPALVADRREMPLSALYALPLLADNVPGGWPAWLRAVGVDLPRLHINARFDDGTALLAAAGAGVGVALGRSRLVENALALGLLVAPWRQCVPAQYTYWLVRPHAVRHTEAATAFAAWVREEFLAQAGDRPLHALAGAMLMPRVA